ncbi:MAG: DUF5132 domain-containing protein [Syntrophobacteraceae bacterium]|nr:DUF5132 domain-containing protein [Syntrophobacteraceae bacterium]
MAILDNGFKLGTGLAIGIGAIILAPVVIPAVAAIVKPLLKAGIKGGLVLYDKSIVAIAEAKEVIEDLAAEARAEVSREQEMAAEVVVAEAVASPAE